MARMRNVKLTIEYDGTSYAGWQVQPNGLGIQEVVQDAIAAVQIYKRQHRRSGWIVGNHR